MKSKAFISYSFAHRSEFELFDAKLREFLTLDAPFNEMSPNHLETMPTEELLAQYGGLIPGHVAFRTGEHGNGHVEKMNFLKDPNLLYEFGRRLAELFTDKSCEIDWVVGPVHMGVVLASFTALHLNTKFTLTYKEMRSGEGIITGSTHFHRAAAPLRGDRILYIDDFTSTGNDLRRNITFLQEQDLGIDGAGLIGIRSQVDLSDLSVDVRSLVTIPFWKVPQEDCELCQDNEPIIYENIRE